MDVRGRFCHCLPVALIAFSLFAIGCECASLIDTPAPYDLAFVTNLDPPGIFVAPADTFMFTLIPGLDDDISRPIAVDYDPVDGMVYWTDVVRKTISRAFLDGTGVVVLVSDLQVPDGMTLDLENRVMYWTDTGTDLIERATMDGQDRAVVVNLKSESDKIEPRAIVVDTRNGYIYWTDWGTSPKIERVNIDGTSRRVVVNTGLQLPNGLAINKEGSMLYWCDAGRDRIESIGLPAGSREVIVDLTAFPYQFHPFDIWFYRGNVYWTDWGFMKVMRMLLSPMKRLEVVGSLSFQKAGGLHVFDGASTDHSCADLTPCGDGERCRQFKNRHQCVCKDGMAGFYCRLDQPCAHTTCQNGGRCFPSSSLTGGAFCQCTDRYTGTNCETFVTPCKSSPCINGGECVDELPDSFHCDCSPAFIGEKCEKPSHPYDLAFVANLEPAGIYVALGDTFNFTLIPGLDDDLGRPVAIDYDPVDGMVYWTDVLHSTISRAFLDGTGVVVLVSDLQTPDGLTLDLKNRVMYWTDTGSYLIERATLDGQDRAVILNLKNESLDKVAPRAIIVDTINEHLYWTDWGSSPKIERANTDGSGRIVLVDTGLQLPNGVALDLDGGRIYWCDAGLDLIESTDLLGSDRRVHARLTSESIHPFDIWVYRGTVYWTDWRFRKLLRLDFTPSTEVTLFGSNTFLRAGGLHIYTDTFAQHECKNPMICAESERCRQYEFAHRCVCKDGLAGANCKLDNPCTSAPCDNGGTCFQSTTNDGAYFCTCPASYSGSHCETFVPPCSSNPCMNDGKCVDELPDTFHCDCISNYVGPICKDKSQPYDLVFVANLEPPGISVAPADTFNFTLIPGLDDDLGQPVAIDYDPIDGMVYWTDVLRETISRAFLDGTGMVVLVSDLNTPAGLSLDIENRLMYWTDEGRDLIERATLDGQDRAVVFNLTNALIDEVLPRAILVDSVNGRIFWTEVGSEPKIERANTDGSSRMVLVDTQLQWPSGLALDLQGNRMYWCEAGLNRIESSDLLGSERRVHAEIASHDIHPFDIWLYRNNLYWTDWRFTELLRLEVPQAKLALPFGSGNFLKAGGLHIYTDNSTDHSCVDSAPCGEGERCRQYQTHHQCVCKDGSAGEKCRLDTPCQGNGCYIFGGTCFLSSSAASGYFCKCNDGYSGTYCKTFDNPTAHIDFGGFDGGNLGNDS